MRVECRLLASWASPLALLALLQGQAWAQTAARNQAQAEILPPDIIVTAQKRSERLQDVPMSITAASAEQLQSRGVTSTDDLAKLVPGFTFQKSTYGLPIYFIRGVGFFETTLGVSPAVTVYTDQFPYPYAPMSRGVVLDLERVEVLKGPQGTLFGQNSTGGAVNYIAAKPTRDLAAGLQVTYGRFNELSVEGFLSGPLSDTVSARLAVRHEYQDDWQKSYVNHESIGEKHFTNVRVILDWRPSDTIRFELQAQGWRDRSDTQQPQFIAYAPLVPPSAGGVPPMYPVADFPSAPRGPRAAAWDPAFDFARNDRFYQFNLRADVDVAESVTLTSLSSYGHLKIDVPQDLDATVYPAHRTEIRGEVESFSQEFRLNGAAGPRFKWMVGGNYQHDVVDELLAMDPGLVSSSSVGPFTWTDTNVFNRQTVSTRSLFGSIDYKIVDTVELQGSVRYSKQDRRFRGCTADTGNGEFAGAFNFLIGFVTGVPGHIPPGGCITLAPDFTPQAITTGTLDEDNLAWRIGANWKPREGMMLYANATKGYKAGSFGTLPAATQDQYIPVKQESVLAYETGFKVDIRSARPVDRGSFLL